jgi:tetratricopeptide (TPR) repeat protein
VCWLLVAIVGAVVSAIIAVFGTPYPWIAIGVAGVGFVAHRGRRVFRTQRQGKRFSDSLALLRASPLGPDARAGLEVMGWEQADALLLLVADAVARECYDEAIRFFDRVMSRADTIGALADGLEVQFPGLPRPVRFLATVAGGNQSVLGHVRGHLLTLAGRPAEALVQLEAKPLHEDFAVGQCAIAEARRAQGDLRGAASSFIAAVGAPGNGIPLNRLLRYKAARLFEESGSLTDAIHEYGELLAGGEEYEDARERRVALGKVCEEERHRATVARDEATFDRVVAQIRAARGPAGRSAALRAGLVELAYPETRERLSVEGLKLEVEAVLDRVNGLKTVAAKQRNLVAALETLGPSDVPYEPKMRYLRPLRDALAALRER